MILLLRLNEYDLAIAMRSFITSDGRSPIDWTMVSVETKNKGLENPGLLIDGHHPASDFRFSDHETAFTRWVS